MTDVSLTDVSLTGVSLTSVSLTAGWDGFTLVPAESFCPTRADRSPHPAIASNPEINSVYLVAIMPEVACKNRIPL